MNDQKNQIKNLLNKSVLVDFTSKQKILDKLEILNNESIDALLRLLEVSENTQNHLLKKVLTVHPDFLDFLENYTAKKINETRLEAENVSLTEDKNILNNLVEKLKTI